MSAALPIIVQKYGGSSVATVDKLKQVAQLVVRRARAGHRMVVVVSAMGDTTDELLNKAKTMAEEPDRRELDMLLSVGERISMSLLAMAIRDLGLEAVSLTGSQSGIITTASHAQARIMEVRPFRVQDELEAGRVVIVAGYQGVSYRRDITTLGRGGSDTTAVALAAALDAEACEIYSDVDGIYSADPRSVPRASQLAEIGYAEMQELAEAGAKVLNAQAVEFAKQRGIAIYAKKTGADTPGTVVRRHAPAPATGVRGIAQERNLACIESRNANLQTAQRALELLQTLGAHAKQVNVSCGHFSCVLSIDDVHNLSSMQEQLQILLGSECFLLGRGAVSLVGEGITRDGSVMQTLLKSLSAQGIEVLGLSTSSFRITVMLASEDVAAAAAHLHQALGLDDPSAEARI